MRSLSEQRRRKVCDDIGWPSDLFLRINHFHSFPVRLYAAEVQRSAFRSQASVREEVEDNSAGELKIVEGIAACHDSRGNTSHITEGRRVMADLVSHVESECKPLSKKVL